jgi:hypothetical protein
MTLFASPDFGAGAMAAGVLLVGFLVVFFLVGVAGAVVTRAIWPVKRTADSQPGGSAGPTPAAGCLNVLLCGVVVSLLGTCLLPRPIFSLYFGRAPADPNRFRIETGMTEEEVITNYGHPHERYLSGDGEQWNYNTDNWGCGISFISVRFDREGRVERFSHH